MAPWAIVVSVIVTAVWGFAYVLALLFSQQVGLASFSSINSEDWLLSRLYYGCRLLPP